MATPASPPPSGPSIAHSTPSIMEAMQPGSGSSTNTFLLPASPARGSRASSESASPAVRRTIGQRPACLVNASVTYCGNNQIYAFGGFDQYTDEVYNHVLKLDLNTYQWQLVDNFGSIPGVRMGHTAALYKSTKLLIYGGENEHRTFLSDVMIFDIETAHWMRPTILGPQPRGRARHASVLHDDKLFIIGGVTSLDTVLNDICYLDLKTWTWSRSWKFVARFDHHAWVWGGRVWVFGGLGQDMDRGNDIWWLDLNSNPDFVDSPSFGHLPDANDDAGLTNYAANSRIHTTAMLKGAHPFAPGHISTLSFVAGPNIPSQSAGKHFHVFSSGYLLDFVTPAQKIRQSECCLTSLHLDSLRWRRLADAQELYKAGYSWHYCAVNEDGTKAWLLGCASGDAAAGVGGTAEEYLSDVLPIDLKKFGVLGNNLASTSHLDLHKRSSSQVGGMFSAGLGSDLAAMFDVAPENGGEADFIVTAENDQAAQTTSSPSQRFKRLHSSWSTATKSSQPIYVHKLILQARWPHFSRLYSSQMSEFHTKKMHIPESYRVVRAFLYYLYTDAIAYHPVHVPDIGIVAGLLVMANIYDLPQLRLLCVNRLGSELDLEHAALIWERATVAGEAWLRRRSANFIFRHFGRIVRTACFRQLEKQSICELCEEVDLEGRIVRGDEMNAAYGVESKAAAGQDDIDGDGDGDIDADEDDDEDDVQDGDEEGDAEEDEEEGMDLIE